MGITAESHDPDFLDSDEPFDLVPDQMLPDRTKRQCTDKICEFVVSVRDSSPDGSFDELGPTNLAGHRENRRFLCAVSGAPSDARPGGNFSLIGLTDNGLRRIHPDSNGGFTGSSNDASGAVHRIDLTNGASIRLDVDAYGNTVTYQGWSLEAGNFDMTPDGTKAYVMAIQILINPNEFSDGQTTKIFVKDLVTGSLTLIDDVDHSTDTGPPRSQTMAALSTSSPTRTGLLIIRPVPTVSITASARCRSLTSSLLWRQRVWFNHYQFFRGVFDTEPQDLATTFTRELVEAFKNALDANLLRLRDLETHGPLAMAQVPLIGGNRYSVFKFRISGSKEGGSFQIWGGPAIFVRVMSG